MIEIIVVELLKKIVIQYVYRIDLSMIIVLEKDL